MGYCCASDALYELGKPLLYDLSYVYLTCDLSQTYWSRDTRKDNPDAVEFPVPKNCEERSRISSIHANGTVRFTNGTEAQNVHSIILATGYEQHIPFLTNAGFLDEVKEHTNTTQRLSTNNRYIRPVFEHTLSLDPAYPLVSLFSSSQVCLV